MQGQQFITTGIARVLWSHLLEPFAGPYPIPRYRAELLIPKKDASTIKTINAAIASAAATGLLNEWQDVNIEHIALPVRDGDAPYKPSCPPDPACAGCLVISASSYNKPDILNIRFSEISDPSEVYNGIYVLASLKFIPFVHKGKPGVRCRLGTIMKIMDGALIKDRTSELRSLAYTARKLHRNIIDRISVPSATWRNEFCGETSCCSSNQEDDVYTEQTPYVLSSCDTETDENPTYTRYEDNPFLSENTQERQSHPENEAEANQEKALEAALSKLENRTLTLEEFRSSMKNVA